MKTERGLKSWCVIDRIAEVFVAKSKHASKVIGAKASLSSGRSVAPPYDNCMRRNGETAGVSNS